MALTKHTLIRGTATGMLMALVAAFGLLGGSAGMRRADAQQPNPDRISVVRSFINALSNWDIDGQVAAFADNAVFIGARATGNCSQQTPCTDPASIRQQAQGNIAIHPCYIIRAIQVSGAVVTGQLEDQSDTTRMNGIPRVLQDFIALVPNNKITFFANMNDIGDPLTALNAQITAGTAQPNGPAIPTPASCGSA
jgi:hypothetical protein